MFRELRTLLYTPPHSFVILKFYYCLPIIAQVDIYLIQIHWANLIRKLDVDKRTLDFSKKFSHTIYTSQLKNGS